MMEPWAAMKEGAFGLLVGSYIEPQSARVWGFRGLGSSRGSRLVSRVHGQVLRFRVPNLCYQGFGFKGKHL